MSMFRNQVGISYGNRNRNSLADREFRKCRLSTIVNRRDLCAPCKCLGFHKKYKITIRKYTQKLNRN